MLRQHHDLFGGYIFDGTVMFLNHKLPQNFVELISKTKEDTLVKITLKYTGTVSSTDGQSLQILNLILRKAMEGLKLELVGRNYFDAAAKV
jgi:aubergine-like protein